MVNVGTPGHGVVLNRPPRSGKSSIVRAIQNTFDGVWMNLGVDGFKQMTPELLQPGIGLRPGGERPDLELGRLSRVGDGFRKLARRSLLKTSSRWSTV